MSTVWLDSVTSKENKGIMHFHGWLAVCAIRAGILKDSDRNEV